MKTHQYQIQLTWTGNEGEGTSSYQAYSRNHLFNVSGKPEILGSSDATFRGDTSRHNPEELLVMAISSCHMLWYLHLCADRGVVVLEYQDSASGVLKMNEDGSGQFEEVILRPTIKVADRSMVSLAITLHQKADDKCFITRSCKFPIKAQPEVSC